MTITNEQIEKAFENTRFGTTDYRGLIQTALIHVAKGYSTGYTIAQVCNELELMSFDKDSRRLTDKGWDYMRDFERCAALTSLLENLPEVNNLTCKDHAVGQGYYKSKIINQIQTKLK
ncbi:MAG: hypothetical protein KAF40_00285 [Flavihumibacter sp.]|nr:hypothetical protein [Flavihumibacter sp.]